jgi:SAM-dependent methyltransferase
MQAFDKDPLGKAMHAYLQGEHDAEIIVHSPVMEDDVIPVHYLFRKWNELPALEKRALEACKGHILDAGAGSGCHSLILQERGADVTALDISEGAITLMQQQGVKKVVQDDLFEHTGGPYDTVLMLMNGIGIVGDLAGLDDFLLKARRLLAPGGQILLESSDILYLFAEEDGSVYIDLNAAYYGQMEYQMEYKGVKSDPFGWLYIDFALLSDHAATAGYACELVYEEEDGHYLARLTLAN